MTLTEIKAALEVQGLRPLKSLGQNFLFDQNLCRQIVQALAAEKGARVVEIGPGLGAITELLLDLDIQLTALEIDRGLIRYLREKFQHFTNFTLVEGDAVQTLGAVEKVDALIGNLPYNASTPMMVSLLEKAVLPSRCLFMLQKETGQRYAAAEKSSDYGAITVYLQSFYHITLLRNVPPSVFYPAPEVHSVIVQFDLREKSRVSFEQRQAFYEFVRQGFSQRRKKLKNLLPVNLELRAEELSVEAWQELFLETEKPE
jgi:16S rRNA (adenine1518-N6/adenine1519-N6)-dimethyltransferase